MCYFSWSMNLKLKYSKAKRVKKVDTCQFFKKQLSFDSENLTNTLFK